MAAQRRQVSAGDVLPWVALIGGAWVAKKLYDGFFSRGHSTTMPLVGTPTLNAGQLAVIADRIYAAAYEGSPFYEDEDDMSRALLSIRNDADFFALFNVYGERSGPVWGSPVRNLIEVFQDLFDDSEVAELNRKLAAKGLTVRI